MPPGTGFLVPSVTTIFARDGLLWRRVLPALALAPLLLWAATREVFPTYLIAVSLFALVGSAELYRLLGKAGYRPLWPLGLGLTFVLAVVPATAPVFLAHAQAASVALILAWVAFRREPGRGLLDWALTVAPPLYVGALLGYYALLRQRTDGVFWVQRVLGCTWAADTGAYLVGRRWGRTRLAPTLSPGKSVEGALGGLAVRSRWRWSSRWWPRRQGGPRRSCWGWDWSWAWRG